MARSATTSDAFNAVAEPRRRQILTLLSNGERSVNDLARRLRVTQPQTSKHLRVLRQVGLVRVRGAGQQRLYALNGEGLKPIHDWVKTFERQWNESFDRLDLYLKKLQGKEKPDGSHK
ncbi:MAG: ArsR/SmtB family transcription factor [Gemmatimonadales bacterium]